MTPLPPMNPYAHESRWVRFWHEPVRAERLALLRILLALALLTDLLISYLPILGELFGPEGVAFAGLHDEWMLKQWHWTILFFNTDDMCIIKWVFALWLLVTILLLVGWHTRIMAILVWFLTMCFHSRNWVVTNSGDDLLNAALFLIMFMPSGRAFSLDWWREKRRLVKRGLPLPAGWDAPLVPAWGVRLLQIQLCVVYLSTGLAKLRGYFVPGEPSTWWEGSSIYYVLNSIPRTRIAWAEFPLPWWATYGMTWVSVWWETLFPLLVLWGRTRKWALWFGVALHLGIFLLLEVGWFSFYTLALYGVWVPGDFWDRWRHRRAAEEKGEPDIKV